MKRSMRTVLQTLLLASLAVASSQSLPRELRRTILEAVVQIVPLDDRTHTLEDRAGSGTVISPNGYILTNFHVVGDTDTGRANSDHAIFVTDPDATYRAPQRRYLARLVHGDPDLDLAVLEIVQTATGRPIPSSQTFAFVALGNSDSLELGDDILVFGYPAVSGVTITLTTGIMSGWLGEGGVSGRSWIKTNAELNRGNSGGGAFNGRGELIGVPTVNRGRRGDTVEEQGLLRPINLATFLGAVTTGARFHADAGAVASSTRSVAGALPRIFVDTTRSTVVGEIGIGQEAAGSLTGASEVGFASWHTFIVRVPAGSRLSRLVIRMTADRDLDLAVKFGSEIVVYGDDTDYLDNSTSFDAELVIWQPRAGRWYIDVYNGEGALVTGTYTLSVHGESSPAGATTPPPDTGLLVTVPGADPTPEQIETIVELCSDSTPTRIRANCQQTQLNGLAYLGAVPAGLTYGSWQTLGERCAREFRGDYSLQAGCARHALASTRPTTAAPSTSSRDGASPSPAAATGLRVTVAGITPTPEEAATIVSLCSGAATHDQGIQVCQRDQLQGLAYLEAPPASIAASFWQVLRDHCERAWVDDYSRQALCLRESL